MAARYPLTPSTSASSDRKRIAIYEIGVFLKSACTKNNKIFGITGVCTYMVYLYEHGMYEVVEVNAKMENEKHLGIQYNAVWTQQL